MTNKHLMLPDAAGLNRVALNQIRMIGITGKVLFENSFVKEIQSWKLNRRFELFMDLLNEANWNQIQYITGCIFIRPFEKRDVLCRGNVRPSVRLSVRLSVCPSVRPRFPDFSSTCFEISIWNLVYTFSRWHDMSSLSCITIGSLWPSLQPKVGQTYFLQSWPHQSRWIFQIWYTGGLLYTSRHKFRFL